MEKARSYAGLIVAMGLIAAMGLIITGPSAHANWFGPTGQARSVDYDRYKCAAHNITDNKNVSFGAAEGNRPDADQAMTWVRNNLLNPTALDTSYVADPGPKIDVYVITKDYDDYCLVGTGLRWTKDGRYGVFGLTNCDTKVATNNRCDKQTVRLAEKYLDVHGDRGDRWLMCHEVGHAIGLRHRKVAGCMNVCVEVDTPAYTPHDINHFNADWTTIGASGTEPGC